MQINGQILDASTGQPLIGANVYVSDVDGQQTAGIGDVTGANGRFQVNLPDSAEYVAVSFIGFDTKVFPISDLISQPLQTLAPGNATLPEVTVTPGNGDNTQPVSTGPRKAGLFSKKSTWFIIVAMGLALASVKSTDSKKNVEKARENGNRS